MLLNASKISFSYSDRPILREVSVSLACGRIVSLLGPNGAGKSTLIRTILGDLHATGTIEWDGKALSSWSRRDLARRVAYLPQTPTSDLGTTVLDVLRLGRASYWSAFGIESQRDAQVVDEVAASLGLRDLLNRSMEELSGGQRQQVFVGRCLVQEPAALLLDEPSTFLDLKHQVELCALLRSLARERQIAVLMASHDLNLAASFSDRLILLHDGAVAATGSPAEVLQPELLQKVYGVPIERIDRGASAPLVFPSIQPQN
jgi:iron complex transport system ATP-binding protein